MSNWYSRAVLDLEEELDAETISYEQFRQELRYLYQGWMDEANTLAEQMYDDVMGDY